jgi:4-amino-4-deoxy-L-arabinose transferase-like glycosyltransferase
MTLAWLRAQAEREAWLPALLAASIVRLWLMPLPSSFWLDEMVTVFVVKHGAAHPSLAAAPQVAKSIYYWLPRGAQALFGSSEVVYRLPSLLAMAAALFLVARLAARFIHPRAAWFAAFACLALSGFDYQAADARPYALGTCVATAGVLALVRWLDTARWRDGLLFALLAALLWRVQLVYWPFYLVFAAYAAARLLRRETPASWAKSGAVFGLVGAALIPVLLDALALFREAKTHVIAALPTLHVFEHALRWNVVLICGAGAWLLNKLWSQWGRAFGLPPGFGPARRPTPVSGTTLVLIAAWWLCQPLCLFAFSWLTGNSVFVPRYLSVMLPGVALAATAAAA